MNIINKWYANYNNDSEKRNESNENDNESKFKEGEFKDELSDIAIAMCFALL